MIRASNAKQIGDKLYNLERIHGKVVTFTLATANSYGSTNLQIEEFRNFIENLKLLAECMSENISGKFVNNYLKAINQVKSRAEEANSIIDVNLFQSCCYLHGTFAKFRQKIKKILYRGCEIDYQKVCSPLLLVELERKQLKKAQNNAR